MISKPHAQETMNAEFGKVAYTIPDTHYIGLSTSGITETTGLGFTEPANAGYSRKAIVNNSTNWTVDSDGYITNAVAIEFEIFTATLSGVTVTHWFISDKENASTSGDRANYYDVIKDASGDPVALPVVSGGKIIIPVNNLKLGRINPA